MGMRSGQNFKKSYTIRVGVQYTRVPKKGKLYLKKRRIPYTPYGVYIL